jgi:hypothetical protein
MDLESEEHDISSIVNLNYLCARIVAFVYSILTSAVGEPYPNRYMMSCFHRIRVMMAKFLIVYRISKGPVNQMDISFPNAIGGGVENEHHMCDVISVVQIFYHMEGVRTVLTKITDPLDSGFQLGTSFVCIEPGQSSCREGVPRGISISPAVHRAGNPIIMFYSRDDRNIFRSNRISYLVLASRRGGFFVQKIEFDVKA